MIWQHISKRDALLIVRRKTGLRGLILDLYEYVKKFHFVIKKNCAINHLLNSMSGKNFIKNYIRGVLSLQNEQRMSNIWLIWERPWGGFANAKCVLRRIWYYAIWDIMTYGILIWHIRYTRFVIWDIIRYLTKFEAVRDFISSLNAKCTVMRNYCMAYAHGTGWNKFSQV